MSPSNTRATTEFALKEISLDVPNRGKRLRWSAPAARAKPRFAIWSPDFTIPTGGRVLLDGHDLRDIEVENYRSLLGIVEQDVFLFDGTIAENIGYANRHATQEEIRHAAEVGQRRASSSTNCPTGLTRSSASGA